MATLHVQLFGRLSVTYDGVTLSGLDARKVQELFGYLLLHRGHAHSRESLADILWPSCAATQSRAYLRKALWQLQRALGCLESEAGSLLEIEPDWIRVNSAATLELDVALLERASDCTRGIRGGDLDDAAAQMLRGATGVYQGDLLEGCYQDWCFYARERLQRTFLNLLEKLLVYCEAHHAFADGISYATQILSYDPAHERTHRRLMRLHALDGDRTAAIRQYMRCTALLEKELNVGPDARTVMLYEQIRSRSVAVELATPGPELTRPDAPTLRDVLDRLRRFQALLSQMQRQVQDDIESVERSANRGL